MTTIDGEEERMLVKSSTLERRRMSGKGLASSPFIPLAQETAEDILQRDPIIISQNNPNERGGRLNNSFSTVDTSTAGQTSLTLKHFHSYFGSKSAKMRLYEGLSHPSSKVFGSIPHLGPPPCDNQEVLAHPPTTAISDLGILRILQTSLSIS